MSNNDIVEKKDIYILASVLPKQYDSVKKPPIKKFAAELTYNYELNWQKSQPFEFITSPLSVDILTQKIISGKLTIGLPEIYYLSGRFFVENNFQLNGSYLYPELRLCC